MPSLRRPDVRAQSDCSCLSLLARFLVAQSPSRARGRASAHPVARRANCLASPRRRAGGRRQIRGSLLLLPQSQPQRPPLQRLSGSAAPRRSTKSVCFGGSKLIATLTRPSSFAAAVVVAGAGAVAVAVAGGVGGGRQTRCARSTRLFCETLQIAKATFRSYYLLPSSLLQSCCLCLPACAEATCLASSLSLQIQSYCCYFALRSCLRRLRLLCALLLLSFEQTNLA